MLFQELFQGFGSIWKLFEAFLTNFENSAEILCYFLKTSEFGRSLKIREPATALFRTTIWRKFVLADKVFCKHLDLVISQLLDKIFQPFKEQKLCLSLGAQNFGVNSEWFAQLLRIRSKTPDFGVTKNSAWTCAITQKDLKPIDLSRVVIVPG